MLFIKSKISYGLKKIVQHDFFKLESSKSKETYLFKKLEMKNR